MKIDREALARECLDYINEHGLKVRLEGHWIIVEPPKLALSLKIAECSNELAELLREVTDE